jgi:hypothetical protein
MYSRANSRFSLGSSSDLNTTSISAEYRLPRPPEQGGKYPRPIIPNGISGPCSTKISAPSSRVFGGIDGRRIWAAAPARGEVRFVDMESGHEVELALDRTTLERYRSGFGAWSDQLSSVFTRANGRYVLVPTDKSEDRFFIEEARRLGLLG